MAAPVKKRAVNPLDNNPLQKKDESESSHDEGSDGEGVGGRPIQEHIQVDFEGRNPCDSDFHGIKQLLQQLFLKAHVDLSQLTDLIISQNYVGSVVKQSGSDEIDDDDEDDESDANDVFGVTSVINLTEKQNLECVQQLRTLLVELCDEHGTDQAITFVRTLLGDDSRPVGLIINERFVNIPPQIAVPLLDSLSKEIKRAKEKKMPFHFSYFIVICKLYKTEGITKRSKKKNKKQPAAEQQEIIWSNPEEELIDKEAECCFEFCVKKESDSGLSGQWMEDDAEMTPYRKVLLVPANKLDAIIEQIKQFVA